MRKTNTELTIVFEAVHKGFPFSPFPDFSSMEVFSSLIPRPAQLSRAGIQKPLDGFLFS
jgi:hypothetical protein